MAGGQDAGGAEGSRTGAREAIRALFEVSAVRAPLISCRGMHETSSTGSGESCNRADTCSPFHSNSSVQPVAANRPRLAGACAPCAAGSSATIIWSRRRACQRVSRVSSSASNVRHQAEYPPRMRLALFRCFAQTSRPPSALDMMGRSSKPPRGVDCLPTFLRSMSATSLMTSSSTSMTRLSTPRGPRVRIIRTTRCGSRTGGGAASASKSPLPDSGRSLAKPGESGLSLWAAVIAAAAGIVAFFARIPLARERAVTERAGVPHRNDGRREGRGESQKKLLHPHAS